MADKEEVETLEFHLTKTEGFRIFHTDGVYGGLTPKGKIFMGLYAERFPLPKKVVHEFNEEEGLGEEVERESISGIVRDIEAGLVMDIQTAISLRDWLSDKIEDFEKHVQILEDDDAEVD